MASSLSNLVNNLLKELIELNVNLDTIKNVKLVELNISIATVFLNMQTLKMINKMQIFDLNKNKNCQIKLDEKLKERFFNTYKFSKHDNNKFILLL